MNSELRGFGFAPRQFNRSPPRGGRTTILTLLIRLENRIKLSSAILSLKTDAPFLANASRHSALNRKLCEGKLGRGENKLEWLAELNAPRENDGGGEQFNGREGETATLLSTGLVTFSLSLAVSPHVISAVRRLAVAKRKFHFA